MRKYLFYAFSTLCLCTIANVQSINKIEYFIDTNPEYGSGTDKSLRFIVTTYNYNNQFSIRWKFIKPFEGMRNGARE